MSHDQARMIAANDGIAFPMPDFNILIGDRWTVLNPNSPWNRSAFGVHPCPRPSFRAALSQVGLTVP
jgi:hypothetical protein